MSVVPYIILAVLIVLPIAWIVAEFKWSRTVRLLLGVAAILGSIAFGYITGWTLNGFNSNAWFGRASKKLVDTTITELKAGNTQQVLQALGQLQEKYEPTYENKARYDVLVDQTVAAMTNITNAHSQ